MTELFHYVIRMKKDDTYFAYFLLESNEGLCFYSTLPHQEGDKFRSLSLKGDIKLQKEIDILIDGLSRQHPVEFISKETIKL